MRRRLGGKLSDKGTVMKQREARQRRATARSERPGGQQPARPARGSGATRREDARRQGLPAQGEARAIQKPMQK